MYMSGFVVLWVLFFFFKQKTAYEMRISDWSSDVCSSDLYFDGCLDYARHERTKEGSLMSLRSRASRPRLLVTRRLPAAVEDPFRARYDVQLNPADPPLDAAALRAAMTRFDAIRTTITARLAAAVPDDRKQSREGTSS